ncbi:MAG: YafY family protein [Bacteroidota bacterium]
MTDHEKPRLARLTAILLQLQTKKLVTAPELAEKYDVSVRTIYRDIRTLERSGVPIVTEEGKGYTLIEGYHLPPVSFTETEANALITAEQLIARNKDTSLIAAYQKAMEKIKAVLRYSEKDKAVLLAERVVFRNNQTNDQTSNHLSQLQVALTNYQVVRIEYTTYQEKTTQRMVEPFAMYSTNDNWVLIAHCQLRQAFRQFRLDRIQQLQLTSTRFTPHSMTLSEYFEYET